MDLTTKQFAKGIGRKDPLSLRGADLHEHEVRSKLNEKLPYQSLIRDAATQSIDTVDINYYLNSIDLDHFLRQAITSLFYNDLPLEFQETLNDTHQFLDWLLACHRLICLGRYGDRHYGGSSTRLAQSERSDIVGMVGRLRGPEDKVRLVFSDAAEIYYPFQYAKRLQDSWAEVDVNAVEFFRRFLAEKEISIYMTEAFEPPMVSELKAFLQSDQIWARSSDPLSCFNVNALVANSEQQKLYYFYPGSQYIVDSIDLMRRALREFFIQCESQELATCLGFVSRFYQVGARSQAVCSAWNSILMMIVNVIMHRAGYGRMPHLFFDYCAMLYRSFEHFNTLFTGFLTGKYGLQWDGNILIRNKKRRL
ncbi:hypothetical protein ACFL6U_02525 [Planctomycetota bacterium]